MYDLILLLVAAAALILFS